MKAFIALALIVSVSAVPLQELDSEWIAFKVCILGSDLLQNLILMITLQNEFRGNSYFGGEAEESVRRQIFETNYAYISAHNAEADKGLHTFRLGVNQFADMTNEEYRQLLNLKVNATQLNKTYAEDVDDLTLPRRIDWRTRNVVSNVKNQEQVCYHNTKTINNHQYNNSCI